ncbi:MAG: glycosyltransferase [Vulcanisaeta sp.]
MDKIVILGCNGGTDIAYGGGAYVVTAMAKCLSESGFEVHLVSTIGLDPHELVSVHNISFGNNVYTHYLFKYSRSTRIPYIIALRLLSRLKNLLNSLNPTLVIYNDDYLLSIDRELRRNKVPRILYAHFPYVTRRRLGLGFTYRTTEWTLTESIINYISIDNMFGDLRDIDYLITNSEGLNNVIRVVHNINDVTTLRPPLIQITGNTRRKLRPIFLHAARQDKTFLQNELTNFMTIINEKVPNSLFIINRNKSRALFKLSIGNARIIATQWMPNDLWYKVLNATKYYLHFKWFEGLGIATAEAVMNGAIPIAYRSSFNGSWTDIARLCDRDCGFSSVDEAVEHVLDFESDDTKFSRVSNYLISELSRVMNYDYFCKSLTSIINKFI